MIATNPSDAAKPYLGQPNPPGIRIFLVVAGFLVLIAGIQLYILTEQTDRYFAWTIQPPITAAFLGASYLSSMVLVWACARAARLAQARIGVLAAGVFTVTTTIATLLHLDPFHFNATDLSAQVAAWAWLVVYVAAPVGFLLALIPILRNRVSDPPPNLPLPAWLRVAFFAHGGAIAFYAVLLLLAPTRSAEAWPWTLSALTARAIAAWLLALGVLAIHSAIENDLDRIRVSWVTAFVFTGLQVIAIARYRDDFDAGSTGGVVYIVMLAILFMFGVAVLWLSGRRRPDERDQVVRDESLYVQRPSTR